MIELCRCPNLPRPLLRIALESVFDLPMRNIRPDAIGDSCAHLRQTLAFRRNDIVHFASLLSLSASGSDCCRSSANRRAPKVRPVYSSG